MVEVRAPARTLSSQAVSSSELCSAPCWCLVKVCSLQSLEGYDSRRVRVRTLCTWHKRILYSNFLSETGHPASFVSWRPVAEILRSITLCWIPLGVCGRCFGTSWAARKRTWRFVCGISSLPWYLSCWPGKWALMHCRPSMDELCIICA